MTNTAESSGVRLLDDTELDAPSGALGPLAVFAVMAAAAAVGAAAGAATAPGKINWDRVMEGFPKPA